MTARDAQSEIASTPSRPENEIALRKALRLTAREMHKHGTKTHNQWLSFEECPHRACIAAKIALAEE